MEKWAIGKRLRALIAASLLTSVQPPAWAGDPVFRHNVHGRAVCARPWQIIRIDNFSRS
jgi:hypothetical protein